MRAPLVSGEVVLVTMPSDGRGWWAIADGYVCCWHLAHTKTMLENVCFRAQSRPTMRSLESAACASPLLAF